jgi:hypothetical protein
LLITSSWVINPFVMMIPMKFRLFPVSFCLAEKMRRGRWHCEWFWLQSWAYRAQCNHQTQFQSHGLQQNNTFALIHSSRKLDLIDVESEIFITYSPFLSKRNLIYAK